MYDHPAGLSRRSMLASALSLGALAAAAQIALPAPALAATAMPKLAAIKSPARALFAENEQVLARYLMSLSGMTNDIVDNEDATYGFMGGGWWRPADTQTPTNSRIMEHIATLAWFYANERPWNPFYKNADLLTRLEAAIKYYTSLQLKDGTYPEYRGEPSLAATTFGVVAQADAYESLRKFGVSYDARLQLRQSMERAVTWFMNPKAAHWTPPVPVFNQVAAGLVAAQRTLQVLDKPTTTQAAVNERITYLMAKGQAPAGFFHEPYGVDFGYNFTVTLPDLAWLYRHTQHPDIITMVQRYSEFMRYAVIREPDTGQLSHIPALHVRNSVSNITRPAEDLSDRGALAKDFLAHVPDLAVFFPSVEEKAQVRSTFVASTKGISALGKPDTSPRTWMYGILAAPGPTKATRDVAEANLPILVSERFVKYGNGSKKDQYLFVRRPSYYVASVFGNWGGDTRFKDARSTRQLGTLWSPTMGTILTSANNLDAPESWETVGPDGAFSTRQSSASSRYYDARTSATGPELSGDKLPERPGMFSQRTESSAGAAKYATGWGYWDTGLRFTLITRLTGTCTHRLPMLLKAGDTLTFADGSTFASGDADRDVVSSSIILTRGGKRVLFSLGKTPLKIFIKRSKNEIAGGVIHRIGILFEKQLDLGIVFLSDDPGQTVQVEAHRHASGDISMRVITLPQLRGTKLSFAGAATGAQVTVPDVADYNISEQTLRAAPGNARTRSVGSEIVTVSAATPDGIEVASSETAIV
ncbi:MULTISPECIES: hypothetical protein [unclassified Pseudoclavibacter]|uniref:hypothetical protein n=1 Tax=unclassified Pseudoclavibacter TaxID=2615177 RepID=UPI001BAA2BB5|nr:hypothetical protein [Pseudoclavibacter sp. Marseille-Q4354]MBS3177249.1 hypothetical protein [Pseudoclavibacter sp. Marseille-Q4354]